MKTLLQVVIAASILGSVAYADDAHHPEQQPNAPRKSAPEADEIPPAKADRGKMSGMHEHMKQMHQDNDHPKTSAEKPAGQDHQH